MWSYKHFHMWSLSSEFSQWEQGTREHAIISAFNVSFAIKDIIGVCSQDNI